MEIPETDTGGSSGRGMLVTDEPGVYLEGRYGIRTENVLER